MTSFILFSIIFYNLFRWIYLLISPINHKRPFLNVLVQPLSNIIVLIGYEYQKLDTCIGFIKKLLIVRNRVN